MANFTSGPSGSSGAVSAAAPSGGSSGLGAAGAALQGASGIFTMMQQNKQAKAQEARNAAVQAGSQAASKIQAQLSTVPASQRRMAQKRLEQKFFDTNPDADALEGFTSVFKGMGTKTEAQLAQEEAVLQQRGELKLEEEGKQFVQATLAGMGTPETVQMLEKYMPDGFSSEELVDIARINNGAAQIAASQQARANLETAQIKLQNLKAPEAQRELREKTNIEVNTEIIKLQQGLRAASSVTLSAMQDGSTATKLAAAQGMQVSLQEARGKFNAFIQGLSPEAKGSLDLSSVQEDFERGITDLNALTDENKVMTYDTNSLKMIHNAYLRGWLMQDIPASGEEGRTTALAQRTTAISLLAGTNPGKLGEVAAQGASFQKPPGIVELGNLFSKVASGAVTSEAESKRATEAALQSSSPTKDKAGFAAGASASALNPTSTGHSPQVFPSTVKMHAQLAQDPEALQEFKEQVQNLSAAWGSSYDEVLDKQYSNYIQHTVSPTILKAFNSELTEGMKFYFEQGEGGISVQGDLPGFEASPFGTTGNTLSLLQRTSPQAKQTQERAEIKRKLLKITRQLNSMSSTFGKMKGVSTADAQRVFAEALNLNLGLEVPKEETNAEEG